MATYIDPDAAALEVFGAAAPEAPIACLNLLAFRERAAYAEGDPEYGTAAADCAGAEAYMRYGAVAMRTIAAVGGRLLLGSQVLQTLIGPEAAAWDQVAIVFYPSRAAFAGMLAREDYQAATHHRRAGLANTRLIVLDGAAFAEA